jgi:hypothetical protein
MRKGLGLGWGNEQAPTEMPRRSTRYFGETEKAAPLAAIGEAHRADRRGRLCLPPEA